MKNKKPFWLKTKQRKTLNGSLDRWRTPRVMKLQHRTKVAGLANNRNAPVDPTRIDAERARYFMELATLEAYKAGVPRPSFPFNPRDVVAVHTHHAEHGEGLWFRLSDGRVFRSTGERDTGDSMAYE
jgi:hypothetical protein